MSEIASVNSAAFAAAGSVGINSNINPPTPPAGEINLTSSQSILSSQFSQTSVLAGNYSSGSSALSEVGNRMMAGILALLDFLFGNKDDDDKKLLGLLALLALAQNSQTQSSSYLQFSHYSATSQSSVSSTQVVQPPVFGSAYSQSGSVYAGAETASAIGGSIDTPA